MKEQVRLPLGITNVPGYYSLKSFKKENEFPYNGLWLFSGAQGFGKTLLMMHLVKEMHNLFPNALIVSNISIYGIPCIPYTGISDFEEYDNGTNGIIFVIDEIQTLFSSLESKDMPPSTIQIWSQNRKNRRVILGTSQRFSRVSKPIREQTILHYECLRPILFLHRYRCYDASLYNDQGKYEGEAERQHFYCPSFGVMTMYSTLEVVKRNNYGGVNHVSNS